MPQITFGRFLRDLSLETKAHGLFGGCLLLLITLSFWWYSSATELQFQAYGARTEQQVHEASRRTGRGMVDYFMLSHHLQKYGAIFKDRIDDQFGKWVAAVGGSLSAQHGDSSFLHPNSTGPDGPQDEFERRVIETFATVPPPPADADSSQPPEYLDRRLPGGDYVYYRPVRAVQGRCTFCHQLYQNMGLETIDRLAELSDGDLAAIVKVRIPDVETQQALAENRAIAQEALRWNRAILIATAIATVFLVWVASWVILRFLVVRPLKHLHDVSDRISRGDIDLRADIHTGDEFENLGAAFNRMLRHLTTVQAELREVNRNLDQKVDQLAQVNMQLYEANRLKADFLATMSHELRTPLNAIIGFSDVLDSIATLDEKQKRYVRNIQTSGKSLLEMINDILDLAKIESGKMQLRLSDFSIGSVVHALCDMARPLTERKNIDLDTDIESDLPELFQDQAKVQQILNNLLSNAIKFTPEGGRIVVSARRQGADRLLLTVADTGIGISAEDQQVIFEKFRQGKSAFPGGDAMTREHSGTGLGLSIVKELCKLLGGEVSLTSELGRGSTFSIELPWTLSDKPRLLDSTLSAGVAETV